MIKVLLADDHPIVRRGIRNELSRHADIQVVGEAVDGDEAIRLSKSLRPDVLVLDITMPGTKALQIVRELRDSPAPPRILVLTAHTDIDNALAMLKAGATGYLFKDEEPSVITDGIRTVAQGKTRLSAAVAQSVLDYVVGSGQSREEGLTARERSVLRMMAKGHNNQSIAEALGLSEGTVKNHVTSIYDKLKVHTRAEAVAAAWQQGLLEQTDD